MPHTFRHAQSEEIVQRTLTRDVIGEWLDCSGATASRVLELQKLGEESDFEASDRSGIYVICINLGYGVN